MKKNRFDTKTFLQAVRAVCVMAVIAGCWGCSDDYKLDNEGSYPDWLGNSIYDELKNPNPANLSGTFTNYLRLVDDLGYAETLSRTGSKTVFPANDEAFERFYQNNGWGVKSYDELTLSMKKQLLYSSMLDNALLLEMLSNVANGATNVTKGIAMRHTTGANVVDTITHIYGAAGMPVANEYWVRHYASGIDLVMDATRPMMVHFTGEQMTTNNITTSGAESDFAVITGEEYTQGATYIFRDKVVNSDVTCKNGYIQQLQDVLVPPGNLAELIRTNGESSYFSRMLDRFSAPYYDAGTTNNYNDYATQNNLPVKDSIFQKRYFSNLSAGGALNYTPDGATLKPDELLPFDPGWNQYAPAGTSNALSDVAAIFVPTDKAFEEYFLPGGSGSFLIEQYGQKENTRANLPENIDNIPLSIVKPLVANLMKASFMGSVPSKFGSVLDDASDPMGITLADINKTSEGRYDVKIANNGVAYMLNKVYAPTKYFAVSAPALFNNNMRVMNWAIQDESVLGQNFYAYLLAMNANYALFIPDNDAFARFYIDPVYLYNEQPRALKFFYNPDKAPFIFCSAWKYNKETGEITDSIGEVEIASVKSQFIDILNYHTVVLNQGEKLGSNNFYKTKHGGEIRVEGNVISGGSAIEGIRPAAKVEQRYDQKNGTAYRIDHVIEAPRQSVYKILAGDERFKKFFDLCQESSEAMTWAGISGDKNEFGSTEQDKYTVFVKNNGLDYNVNYFNTFNYTVYAPDNAAMDKAFAAGLPSWEDVEAVMNAHYATDAALEEARAKAFAMIEEINKFVRYHIQDNSVYADNTVEDGNYQTACLDAMGRFEKLAVGGGSGEITITDNRDRTLGRHHRVTGTAGQKINQMARDYVFTVSNSGTATAISTSSFAVVHELPEALNRHAETDRYDGAWASQTARRQAVKRWKAFLKAQAAGERFY